MPIAALADKRVRDEFLQWRDNLAKRSPRQADYAYAVLALILSWAKGRGTIDVNPCERGGKLYSATRADKIWREHDESSLSQDRLARSLYGLPDRYLDPASVKAMCSRSLGPHTTARASVYGRARRPICRDPSLGAA